MKVSILKLSAIILCLVASLSAAAERNIDLSLNKHNFEAGDTICIGAKFLGFTPDPIIGEVYADLIAPNDSVVESVVLKLEGDQYVGAITLPAEGIVKRSDITLLSKTLSYDDMYIYSNQRKASLMVDGVVNTSPRPYEEFLKIPFNTITYLSFRPWHIPYKRTTHRSKNFVLVVRTARSYPVDNVFRLQVTGATESGEVVAAIEPMTIHVMHYMPYFGDESIRKEGDNYLRHVPMEEYVKLFHSY